MTKREARRIALGITVSMIEAEIDSPTGLTTDLEVWDNQEKIHVEMQIIADQLLKRARQLYR